MAIIKSTQTTTLVIDVENGVNETGAVVFKQKSFSNVRPGIEAEKVYAVAEAISAVLSAGTGDYRLRDNSILVSR